MKIRKTWIRSRSWTKSVFTLNHSKKHDDVSAIVTSLIGLLICYRKRCHRHWKRIKRCGKGWKRSASPPQLCMYSSSHLVKLYIATFTWYSRRSAICTKICKIRTRIGIKNWDFDIKAFQNSSTTHLSSQVRTQTLKKAYHVVDVLNDWAQNVLVWLACIVHAVHADKDITNLVTSLAIKDVRV